MKYMALALLVIGLSGCADTYIRYVNSSNPLPTQQQWMQARYSCMQQTQQRVSQGAVGPYGGAATSQVMPSCSAFNACLATMGYYRSDTADANDINRPGSYTVPQGTVIYCNP